MERLKHYLEKLNGRKYRGHRDRTYQFLSECLDLDDDRKNFLFNLQFPRKLLDMELPGRILSYRGEEHKNGYLEPNIVEIGLLAEAYVCDQYFLYMRHLLHSFCKEGAEVFPLAEGGQCECGICKKQIWSYDEWSKLCQQYPDSPEKDRKEFLAFASDHTKQNLCIDCLVQLDSLHHFLKMVDGDNYLDWRSGEWNKMLRPRHVSNPSGEDAPSEEGSDF